MRIRQLGSPALMLFVGLIFNGGCDSQDHVPWTFDAIVVEKTAAGKIEPLEEKGGRANLLGVRIGAARKVGMPPNEFFIQVVEVRTDWVTFEVTHLDRTKTRHKVDRGRSADSFSAGGLIGLQIRLRAR